MILFSLESVAVSSPQSVLGGASHHADQPAVLGAGAGHQAGRCHLSLLSLLLSLSLLLCDIDDMLIIITRPMARDGDSHADLEHGNEILTLVQKMTQNDAECL